MKFQTTPKYMHIKNHIYTNMNDLTDAVKILHKY